MATPPLQTEELTVDLALVNAALAHLDRIDGQLLAGRRRSDDKIWTAGACFSPAVPNRCLSHKTGDYAPPSVSGCAAYHSFTFSTTSGGKIPPSKN